MKNEKTQPINGKKIYIRSYFNPWNIFVLFCISVENQVLYHLIIPSKYTCV